MMSFDVTATNLAGSGHRDMFQGSRVDVAELKSLASTDSQYGSGHDFSAAHAKKHPVAHGNQLNGVNPDGLNMNPGTMASEEVDTGAERAQEREPILSPNPSLQPAPAPGPKPSATPRATPG